MTSLASLWLPILLSAVAVFVASSVVHMAMPWHKSDYPRVPHQDEVLDALRPFAIPPGDYMVPRVSTGTEMKSPEFLEKLKKGPVLMMTVMPNGPMAMGMTFVFWFIHLLAIGLLCGYVAGSALPPAAPRADVFRLVGVPAFLAHAAALWPISIWYRRAWTSAMKGTFDGVLYAVITAAIFGWLWPR